MNKINPVKLQHSKWTAVNPANREKHFLVVEIAFEEDGSVAMCKIEAVLSKRQYEIDWRQLADRNQWLQGWR